MSREIDERVVSMQFDNSRFERNVATTMSTLDKLKQKLHFTGAAKSLEGVGAAVKNISMDGLTKGVETVSARFSALEVMGVTALANITNSAVNAGKRMLSALTIDPISQGWSEYELKMNSVQTIMASTGESLETVNKYLEELNKYSDQTIYSFSDMTQNIGKFTNAGVKLEDAVAAIKGISNEAAISGANSNEASRAMYNFAQALSAGYVKLIDWKSIELANMATVDFKQQLIDTAVEVGTLTKATGGLYNAGAKTMNATQGFNESLEQEWMTTEVLTKTLAKYADETTDIGKKATQAATEVKTFSMMCDTLKESAQSGWAQTWELIFGDFYEGKALWTNITNVIGGVIDRINDARNNLIKGALSSPFGKVLEKVKSVTGATEKMKEVTQDYGQIVNSVIRGEWGNGQARWNKLAEAGYNWAKVQNLVNERLECSVRHNEDLAEAQIKNKKAQEATAETQSYTLSQLVKMNDEELKKLKFTEAEIESLRELAKQAETTGIPVEDLAKDIDQLSGRTLLLNSFKNIGQGVAAVFKSIGKAYNDIFGKSQEESVMQLYELIQGFHKFTMNLRVNDETADKLRRTLRGVFAVLDIIRTVVSGGLKVAINVINGFLSAFDLNILDVTAAIGDMLYGLRNWLLGNDRLAKGAKKVGQVLAAGAKWIKKWFDAFVELPFVQNMLEKFKAKMDEMPKSLSEVGDLLVSGARKIKSWITAFMEIPLVQKVIEKLKERMMDIKDIGSFVIEGLRDGLQNGVGGVIDILKNIGQGMLDAICKVLGIHSPSKAMIAIGGFIIAGLLIGIKNFLPGVWEAIAGVGTDVQDILGGIDWGKIIAGGMVTGIVIAIKNITSAVKGFGDMMSSFGGFVEGIGEPVQNILNNTSKVVKGFAKTLSGLSWDLKARALKNMAISIAILAGTIIVLTFIKTSELWNAVAVVGALAFILVGLAFAMSKMQGPAASIGNGAATFQSVGPSLKSIALSLLLVAAAVKLMGSMDRDELIRGFLGLGGVIVAVGAVVIAFGKFVKGDAASNIEGLGKMMTKMAIAMLLMIVVVKLASKLEWSEMGKGLVFAAGFGAFIWALIYATRDSSKHIGKIGGLMVKISFAMLLMVGVVKLASKLEWSEMGKGLAFAAGFSLFVLALVGISKLAGESDLKAVSSMMLKISTAMLLMAGVIMLIGLMSRTMIIKGIAAITAFGGIITGLIAATKLAGKDVGKIGTTILAISGAIAILASVAIMLGVIPIPVLVQGTVAIGVFALIITGLIAATKLAGKRIAVVGKTMLLISAAIAVLAGIAIILGLIPIPQLKKGVQAVAVLSALMAGLMITAKFTNRGSIGVIITIGAVMVALAGVLWLLSTLPTRGLVAAAGALTGVVLAMGVFMMLLSKFGKLSTRTLVSVSVITLVVAGLGGVLYLISGMNPDALLHKVAALSVLMLSVSAFMFILKRVGSVAPATLVSVSVITLVVAGLGGVLYLISGINPESIIQKVTALSVLMLSVSAFMLILKRVGTIAPGTLVSVSIITLVVLGLAGVLLLLDNMNAASAIPLATALSILLGTMSVVCMVISKIPVAGAIQGSLGLAAFIGVMAVVLAALGALAYIPGFNELIAGGGEVLATIGYAIGNFVGSIIGGLGAGLSSGLPEVGTNLSEFMTNATPFIEGLKTMDSSMIDGVGVLVSAILGLTVASFVDAIATFLSGGDSFSRLGTELTKFITNATPFLMMIQTVNPAYTQGAKNLADMVLTLTAANLLDGIASFFTGESSLGKFGKELVPFGEAMAEFSRTVTGAIDPESVTAAASAGKMMAEMAKTLPNSGGVVGFLCGENDMDDFADMLVPFGKAIAKFSKTVKDNVDGEAVTAAASAGKAMAEMAKTLPNSGGVVGFLCGENDMDDFGTQLVSFGKSMAKFSAAVDGQVKSSVVTEAAAAGKALAAMAAEIPNSGGLVSLFTGDNQLKDFADQLPTFGEAIADFSTAVAGKLEKDDVLLAVDVGKGLVDMAKEIPNQGGIFNCFTGAKNLTEFGSQLKSFGIGICGFATATAGLKNFPDLESIVKSSIELVKIVTYISENEDAFEDCDDVSLAAFSTFIKDLGSSIKSFGDASADIDLTAVGKGVDGGLKMVTLLTKLKETNFTTILANTELFKARLSTFSDAIVEFYTDMGTIDTETLANDVFEVRRILNQLGDMGEGGVSQFITALKNSDTDIAVAVSDMVTTVKTTIEDREYEFNVAAGELMTEFANGVSNGKETVTESTGTLLDAINTTFSSGTYASKFYTSGTNVVKGFAKGITAQTWEAEAQAAAMAQAALDAANEKLDVNSPSKEFYKTGKFAGQGFVNAFKDYQSKSYAAGYGIAEYASNGLSRALAGISDLMTNGNSQPTIRPVVDLTEVVNSAGRINSLLNVNPSVGVLSSVGSINASMTGRIQNGRNDDVVSAINELGKNMGNNTGDTYHFGNFTYDNGSEIAEAVHALVRAARIEGRV